jgi:hypothetical protein
MAIWEATASLDVETAPDASGTSWTSAATASLIVGTASDASGYSDKTATAFLTADIRRSVYGRILLELESTASLVAEVTPYAEVIADKLVSADLVMSYETFVDGTPDPISGPSTTRLDYFGPNYYSDPLVVMFIEPSFIMTVSTSMSVRVNSPLALPSYPVPSDPPTFEDGAWVYPVPAYGGIDMRALMGKVIDMDTPVIEDGQP